MGELLPTEQAARLRRSLLDYLSTTFALADGDAQSAVQEFLSDPANGIFKGPYIRTRLPFAPAAEGWRKHLGWVPDDFTPYVHQAAAFARLSSQGDRRPQPTLVTTGTGSGKTEAFQYPILDHVLRARRQGIAGTKALILYPMNALANDQAERFKNLILGSGSGPNPLSTITAAIYTGEEGDRRTMVTEAGLINDRAVMRDEAPDILLTNYKMLDQLLLRALDQPIWQQSAESLQYIVLDEFHTYDGAQGTDVAMLLRRLGFALKSYWPERGGAHDRHTDEEWRRPLGAITPVGTSATLGGSGDVDAGRAMAGFASDIFGEAFDDSCIITEERVSREEWCRQGVAVDRLLAPDPTREPADQAESLRVTMISAAGAVAAVEGLGDDPAAAAVTDVVLTTLWGERAAGLSTAAQLDLMRQHPFIQQLLDATLEAADIRELAAALLAVDDPKESVRANAAAFIEHVTAALSHLRAKQGRSAPNVEVHLWIRELTRVDRLATGDAQFRWSDDGSLLPSGAEDRQDVAFPAIYCRHCGRSGWGMELASVGTNLSPEDRRIRANHAAGEGRFRALLSAQESETGISDDQPPVPHAAWLRVDHRSLSTERPDPESTEYREGAYLPVLMLRGNDADDESRRDVCPHCGQAEGIRFLGSAIATQLSVCLTTLFGAAQLNVNEKKALVFTDSVQDAAHRAGFVTARSHTLTMRAVMRHAAGTNELTLVELSQRIRGQASTPAERYRLLPIELAANQELGKWWRDKNPSRATRRMVESRVLFDSIMEFGLQSRIGRTLEQTGSMVAHVDAGSAVAIANLARQVLRSAEQDTLDGLGDSSNEALVRWVRGVLERLRTQGAIHHPWFTKYIDNQGARWFIWGGRPKGQGMPAFPDSRPAPAFARIGGARSGDKQRSLFDSVTDTQSWYATWGARNLGITPQHGAVLARALFTRLAREEILTATQADAMTVYGLPADRVLVAATREAAVESGDHRLFCTTCRTDFAVSHVTQKQLVDGPCLLGSCPGRLTRRPMEPSNFYRHLYDSADMRRVVAREHTGLLDDRVRVAYEDGFRSGSDDPSAPNVLVATPTLEMGIDIGDLSSVFLASLPNTVASYLQRIGRAGRLTGNALDVAFVQGWGQHLPRLGDPSSMINGPVRPPATYLSAEEILKRQYLAHLADRFARDDEPNHHPQRASRAIGSAEPGSYLGDVIADAHEHAEQRLDEFLAAFEGLPDDAATGLRSDTREALVQWASSDGELGSSGLANTIYQASNAWQQEIEELGHRRTSILEALPELRQRSETPAASDDDRRALRAAEAALRLVDAQSARLRGEYWISVLEQYGLFPNYTLIDDSVTLDVQVTWINPDTREFEAEQDSFHRGSSNALRDFAPGATFYAKGWQIPIDSVDLGHDHSAVRRWAFCAACGYGVDLYLSGELQSVASCPRCGDTTIADTSQRLDVVELSRVSASVRREESRIDDRSENRDSRSFALMVAADIDPDQVRNQWYAGDHGFGVKYVHRLPVRWLNVGPRTNQAARLAVAGQESPSLRFRVCAGCGHIDQTTRSNARSEHRPWCEFRDSDKEQTLSVVLSRTLDTQGVVVRLPVTISHADVLAVPSLAAALLLGLREQFGGTPDHLGVETITDPSPDQENAQALLIHDRVPGGTGYLAELANPERVWQVLRAAWLVVRDCECRSEGRLSCHRCLLPFTRPSQADSVSRESAARHLGDLLGAVDSEVADQMGWHVEELPPHVDIGNESYLEVLFRSLFRKLAEDLGGVVRELPGPTGNTITVRFGDVMWRLTPQVNLLGSKPDFILSRPGLPDVAIFPDGYSYHATSGKNRIADDASKRQLLRQAGHLVLAVTHQDALAERSGERREPPGWFTATLGAHLIGPFGYNHDAQVSSLSGPFGWLRGWMQGANTKSMEGFATSVPLHFTRDGERRAIDPSVDLGGVAKALLDDDRANVPTGGVTAWWWRDGPLGVLVRARSQELVDVAVVLDDRPAAVAEDGFRDSWRQWLELSNVLQNRLPETITILTSYRAAVDEAVASPVSEPAEPIQQTGTEWDAIQADLPSAAELLTQLIAAGVPAPDGDVGEEIGADNIPVDLVWHSRRVAVLLGATEEDVSDLRHDGWTVADPTVEAIGAAVGRES